MIMTTFRRNSELLSPGYAFGAYILAVYAGEFRLILMLSSLPTWH